MVPLLQSSPRGRKSSALPAGEGGVGLRLFCFLFPASCFLSR